MDYYYTSSPSVSSRGRFSSRGSSSYRGSGRGESSYRGSRGSSYSSSRGYTSSRGRGSYYPKYETSTSKYTSSSSDGGRYVSHPRMEDTSYRKPESSGYSSVREHSHHRSDVDVGRKRIRSDNYSQSQGTTSSRRSHEMEDYRGGGGGGGGGSSGSRYSNSNSYTDSRSYSENRGVFKKPRISEYKTKEEYRGRKEISRSSVAVSKLRSLRGRSIRGLSGIRRGSESFLARKRAAFSGSRSASEIIALRRAKLMKLKRWRERARVEEEKAAAEDKKEAKAVEEEEELAKKLEEENEEIEKEEKRDKDREKDKDRDKDKKEEGEICDGETEIKEKEKSKKSDERLDFFRKPFIKLQCPQCLTRCVTFKEYNHHLYQATHMRAMKEKSEQLKATLAKMRIAQRAKQKKMDEEDLTNMNTRSAFCTICKLNYSQGKSVHQASESHKKLKNFLQPYCRVCRIYFKGPMSYERHVCSLEHQRKKNALDERLGRTKGSSLEYLDNFMVLDSVGSGDEGEDSKESKPEEETKKEKEKTHKGSFSPVGAEFIRKVEALYCEVCRTCLPLMYDQEKMLRIHCRSKYHFRCYLRFGSAELLAQIRGKQKGESSENGEGKTVDKTIVSGAAGGAGTTTGLKETENHDKGGEDEIGIDDKLWPDVSDILSQVELDDEDEEEGGRFDRFRSNEKKENGEVNSSEDTLGEKEKGDEPSEGLKVAIKEVA